MRVYVGLDVHSKWSVFVIEQEDGKVIGRGQIPTTPAGLGRLKKEHRLGAGDASGSGDRDGGLLRGPGADAGYALCSPAAH